MAGPMSGGYVIGSSTYPTFNAAVDSLIKLGIDGPVVFEVVSGTYDEQVCVPNISGTSESNTITFEAQTPGENNVILEYASSHSDTNYIVRLDSSHHIHLSGFTFIPKGIEYRNSIEIVGNSKNISLKNNFFKTPIENKGYQIFISSFPLTTDSISNIMIEGNYFEGGDNGIHTRGFINQDSFFTIKNNDFRNHSSLSIDMNWGDDISCYENTFESEIFSTAFRINASKGKNYFYDNKVKTAFGISLIGSESEAYIFNNILDCEGHSLFLAQSKNVNCHNNSILNNSTIASLLLNKCDSIYLFDNIIQNRSEGLAIQIDSISKDISMNNNVYFSEGDTIFQYIDDKFTSLTDWQNITISGTRDPNSAVGKIEFLDTINYNLVHCSTDPALQFSSASSFDPAELANDYNGVARNPANFWPGATELTIDEGKIVKVSGFVAQGTDTLKAGTLVAYVDSSERQLLDQVGETTINADGSFSFDSVPALPLWIRIYPEDTNYLTSYHDSVIRKSQSTPLNPADCDGLQTDIFPRRIYPFEFDGLGTIEGYVTYADLSSSKVTAKDPIPGLDVVLDRIPPSKSIKATVTNGDNFYSFGGLPDGTYSVTIEYEGLDADTIYVIDVVSSDPRNTDKNYCIDTTRAITDCTPPESVNEFDAGLKLYPNPFNHQLSIQAERNIDRVRIIDLRGLVVLDEKLNASIAQVNTSHIVPAVYFIELFSGEDKVVKKVIKQ